MDYIWSSCCNLIVHGPGGCKNTSATLFRQTSGEQAQTVGDSVSVEWLCTKSSAIMPNREENSIQILGRSYLILAILDVPILVAALNDMHCWQAKPIRIKLFFIYS